MLTVTVTGLDRVARSLRRVSDQTRLPLMRALDPMLKHQVAETFDRQRDPVTGRPWRKTSGLSLRTRPSGGGRTLVATGQLRNSIVSRRPDVSATHVRLGSNLPYAAIHQAGGRITPKRAAKLWIPLTPEARKMGPRRFMSRNPGAFILKGKSVATRTASGLKFHFALVDSVTIPARPYLGIGPVQAREITKFVGAWIGRALREGGAS